MRGCDMLLGAALWGAACAPATPTTPAPAVPAATTPAPQAVEPVSDDPSLVRYGTRGYTWRGFEFWGWNCGERELDALLSPGAGAHKPRLAAELGSFEPSDKRVQADDGRCTYNHEVGGVWAEGNVGAGLPTGRWRFLHPNGQVCSEGSFERGKPIGPWVWRHPNGEIAAKGAFIAGERSGDWVVRSSEQRYAAWNLNYAQYRPFTSHRGFPQGRKPKGEPSPAEHDVWRGRFENGRRVGPWKHWHPNGTLALEGTYADGFQDGEWRAWDDYGQLLEVSVWDAGRKTKVVELHEDRLGLFGRVKVRGKDVDVALAAAESPEAALAAFLTYEGAEDMLADPLILGGAAVVPVLVKAVADRDLDRRLYAISALGSLRDRRALPVLVSILEDTSERFRDDALDAILQIDEWLAREMATRYQDGGPEPDQLARAAQDILSGDAWYTLAGRSYVEALLHRHL